MPPLQYRTLTAKLTSAVSGRSLARKTSVQKLSRTHERALGRAHLLYFSNTFSICPTFFSTLPVFFSALQSLLLVNRQYGSLELGKLVRIDRLVNQCCGT